MRNIEKLGKKVADFLYLKPSTGGLISTSWGTKTIKGIGNCILAIAEEELPYNKAIIEGKKEILGRLILAFENDIIYHSSNSDEIKDYQRKIIRMLSEMQKEETEV